MITAKITFHKCIQDSRLFGSNDQLMVSRIFLSVEVGGRNHTNLHADVHQEPGSTFDQGELKLGPIQGYDGPLNAWAFKQALETYYRSLSKHEEPRLKVSFGKNARRMENVVIHESVTDLQIYE
jgi:hypothetical protein